MLAWLSFARRARCRADQPFGPPATVALRGLLFAFTLLFVSFVLTAGPRPVYGYDSDLAAATPAAFSGETVALSVVRPAVSLLGEEATAVGSCGVVAPAAGADGASTTPLSFTSTPSGIGTAERFSVHGRVAAQLDDARLGSLAGRYGVDDLQGLLHAPGSRAYFDTATRNINVVQEVDGVLLRITTASDEFRIISVGRLRDTQLQNGIANGRFVPIGPGG